MVDFVRRSLVLPVGTVPEYVTDRIERTHKALVRERLEVRNDQRLARLIADGRSVRRPRGKTMPRI